MSRRFAPETASVREVRQYVAESITDVPIEQAEIILLAASELAANSVRHARTDYTVTVDRTEDEVRVTVDDDGTGDPEVQDPGPLTPSGRGLLIVEQLSDAWGSSSNADHNRVWFSMRITPEGSAPSSRVSHEAGPHRVERDRRGRVPPGAVDLFRSRGHRRRAPRLHARSNCAWTTSSC